MTTVLKGTEVVEAMNRQMTTEVADLAAEGIRPTLAIVRVGERGDDIAYERSAIKRAENVGVCVRSVVSSADVSLGELLDTIRGLNDDASVHGILIFRPLPQHLDEKAVCGALAPEKDIDGITDASLAGVFTGAPLGFAPCTAQACMKVLDYFGCGLAGKRVLVIGRSLVVGKPVAMMLLERDATVTIAHSHSKDLPTLASQADIVVVCVGRPHILDTACFAVGQTIIDVGINVTEEGTLVGDADFEAAQDTVAAITPVPGGVGTVTTSILVSHVIEAARRAAQGR